jgi:hypothetical protein
LAKDIDPKEHKDDKHREQLLSASNTFKTVATDWFAIKKTTVAEVTARSLWRKFENHVFPKLGHPSESAKAQWSEIDFENQLWTIPAERMKMRLEHKIPLTPQTIEILTRLKPLSGDRKYLFPSYIDHNKHCNIESANKALCRMGYKNKLVAYGLRALASTTLNEQGHDPDVIEAALSHVDKNEVRRAYNRAEYLERRRVLMCWWSQHINTATYGKVSVEENIKHLEVV